LGQSIFIKIYRIFTHTKQLVSVFQQQLFFSDSLLHQDGRESCVVYVDSIFWGVLENTRGSKCWKRVRVHCSKWWKKYF